MNLSEPMPPEQMAKFWVDFINGHIPNFRKSPYDQIDNYVKDCWTVIVDSAKWAQKDLPGVLDQGEAGSHLRRQRDPVSGDQAVRQAWVRIISCSENEIEDPDIPPHLSGCAENDSQCHQRYRDRFNEVIKPIHDDFNAFLATLRRGALSDRPVLRGVAVHEPAALSGAGEVQAAAPAAADAVPVSRRLRAQGEALRGAGLRGEQRQAADLRLLRQPRLRRHRSPEAHHRDDRQAALPRAGQCRRLHGSVYGRAAERHHRQVVSAALGDPAGRCRHPPRRQQLVHGMPLLRQARDHHALCLGRPRQRDARPGDRPRLQDAPLRLDRRRSCREARRLHQRSGDQGEARRRRAPTCRRRMDRPRPPASSTRC